MAEHVAPLRVYYAVFTALMLLTALTVSAAFADLGPLNTAVALAIAVTKAVLVVLYFMHLRWSPGLTSLVVAVGVVFLAVLIGLTMSDVVSRGWLGVPGS
jgi:cytochrome c oxidase subunit 4